MNHCEFMEAYHDVRWTCLTLFLILIKQLYLFIDMWLDVAPKLNIIKTCVQNIRLYTQNILIILNSIVIIIARNLYEHDNLHFE